MSSDERPLSELVDRDLPWPTQMEFVAARDRVLDQLRATPEHQVPRVPEVPGVLNRGSVVRVAAAAALVIVAVGGAMVWPRGARVYAAGNDGLQVTLADDSRVEMRAHSEMTVGRGADGIQIDLRTGDIIVTAAEQHDGHLYVRTKDMTIAVDGTVFLVNAGQDGSRVGVIEGEVRVREGNRETRLRPGEQVATSSTIVSRPLTEEINWSKNAKAHRAILDSKVIAQAAVTLAPIAPPGQGASASSQAAKTEFEEASIRPCDPNSLPPGGRNGGGGANMLQMTPGRTNGVCLTLATLIRIAYGAGLLDGFSGIRTMGFSGSVPGVEDGIRTSVPGRGGDVHVIRLRGGPDWVRSDLYTIEAVAGGPADAQTMRGPMLRALLERRVGLKVHMETEQIPGLKLTVAPGGLKMKEGICTKSETPSVGGGRAAQAAQMAAAVRRNLDAMRRGVPVTGRCGGVALHGPNLLMVGAGSPVQPFAEFFSRVLEAPVVDQTGIPDTALFNYVLEFDPDGLSRQSGPMKEFFDLIAAGGGDMQIASDPSVVPRAPELVTAVEQQLGLRLERGRTPREFIVIDQVERPSPN